MCEISNLINNINSLILPSTLWAVHVDPKQEFLAILHVNVNDEKINLDKGVLLTTSENDIKVSATLNDEIVQLPQNFKVETISDLSNIVYILDHAAICDNFNITSICSKYVFGESSNVCRSCVLINECEAEEKFEAPNEIIKEEKDNKHLCTVCGKTFNFSSLLEHHMLSHSSESERPFKCQICKKAFTKKYNLNVHSRVHSGERPYVCSQCGKTYSTRSNLSTHMNSVHCEEKKHRCEFCGNTFVHPRMLRIHMRKHTGERPFMCQICGKVFSRNIHLTVHLRSHTGEKPYLCQVCGKAFATTGNLSSHKRINHKIK